MPIKFRCAYCSQLMGIARRKAGTVVKCPSCGGQVVVPDPGEVAPEEPVPGKTGTEPDPQLFERSDFDEFFEPVMGRKQTAAKPVEAPAAPMGDLAALDDPRKHRLVAEIDVPRPDGPRKTSAPTVPDAEGIWVSRAALTWATVGAVIALAIAFAAGLWLGKSYAPTSDEPSSALAAPSLLA